MFILETDYDRFTKYVFDSREAAEEFLNKYPIHPWHYAIVEVKT